MVHGQTELRVTAPLLFASSGRVGATISSSDRVDYRLHLKQIAKVEVSDKLLAYLGATRAVSLFQ